MRTCKFLIAIVCLVLLIASHRFAFYRGEKQVEKAIRQHFYQMHVEVEFRNLRRRVAILRVMVKHPDRFQDDIAVMRIKGKLSLIGGEWIYVRHFEEIGDEARAREAQSLLDEGRELFAKLPSENQE